MARLTALAALCALVPALAFGDGIVIKPHKDGWRPGIENSQQAIITHAGGIQRLIVAVDIEETEAESMVWLLPVPAGPRDITVDVLVSFPRVIGTEVYGGALENLKNMRFAAAGSQLWPVAVLLVGGEMLFSLIDSWDSRKREASRPAAAAAKGDAVTVHAHVEKEGMTIEVITAREVSAIYGYLESKGLKLGAGALPALDTYIGKDYSFIASWVTPDPSARREGYTRGLDLRFPTKDLFFPLLPTSGYGERVVPASIRIAGFVTPQLFPDIERHTAVGYHVAHIQEGSFEPAAMRRYTKIDIGAPAKAYTQDLWISSAPPQRSGLELATQVTAHPVVTFFLLLLPVSVVASILAGSLVYRGLRTRLGAARFALMGLANGISLLGILFLLPLLPSGWKRRTAYVFSFSLLFMGTFLLTTLGMDVVLEPMRP